MGRREGRELRLAATGDRDAADRYHELLGRTTDRKARAYYRRCEGEARASCGRNLIAARATEGRR